jgi:UDP-glucose 4-epimerase
MPISLVTGDAGFIGSHVADHLLELGHKVVVLDDLSGGFIDNVPTGATFVNGSILDEQLVERLFAENEIQLCVPSGGLRRGRVKSFH